MNETHISTNYNVVIATAVCCFKSCGEMLQTPYDTNIIMHFALLIIDNVAVNVPNNSLMLVARIDLVKSSPPSIVYLYVFTTYKALMSRFTAPPGTDGLHCIRYGLLPGSLE
jgi:hypothetical protein